MFYVGQKVVCINQEGIASDLPFPIEVPVKGRVYTIRDSFFHSIAGADAVRLVEIKNPIYPYDNGMLEHCFGAFRFRPIEETKTDISIFTDMLRPVDVPSREKVEV